MVAVGPCDSPTAKIINPTKSRFTAKRELGSDAGKLAVRDAPVDAGQCVPDVRRG